MVNYILYIFNLNIKYFITSNNSSRDFEPGEDTFDRQVYKEYTQMGTKVKFLVWPALYTHTHTEKMIKAKRKECERGTQFQHNMY
jgi:hypothetical protein